MFIHYYAHGDRVHLQATTMAPGSHSSETLMDVVAIRLGPARDGLDELLDLHYLVRDHLISRGALPAGS